MSRYYHLGPWVWAPDLDGGWRAPEGAVGIVDLRPLPQQALVGTPQGCGFFVTNQPLGSDYEAFGTQLDAVLTADQAKRWCAMLGLRPLGGATLLDALWETLTYQSDPEGVAGPLPLDCTTAGDLELYLGGHSLVRSRRLVAAPGDEHWKRLKKMLQDTYKQTRKEAREGRRAANLHRKMMTLWCRKYGVDYHELLGGEPDEPPLAPETTYAEDFNGPDKTPIGYDLAWQYVGVVGGGAWSVYSNQCRLTGADASASYSVRAEHDLSSADHYAQALVVQVASGAHRVGPCARFSASADTFYATLESGGTTQNLEKWMAGVITYLATPAIAPALPEVYKVTCNGSTIKGWQAGVERASVTDSSITGNTRGGLRGKAATAAAICDDFAAADFAAAAARIPWHLFFGKAV